MKTTQRLLIALTIALTGASAFAIEATQWNPPAGTRTRAEVKAELRAAQASGEMAQRNEAYGGFERPMLSTRSRHEVQAEGARAMREHKFNELYVD